MRIFRRVTIFLFKIFFLILPPKNSSPNMDHSLGEVVDTSNGQQFSAELLEQYYKRLMPAQQMFQWLSYGNDPDKASEDPTITKDYFQRREICFTLEDDIYIRYNSFRDGIEFQRELVKKMPHKIDIGAVFSHPPNMHNMVKAGSFKPLQRELVFDIDLTDYDEVGAANADIKKGMGKDCWYFMAAAIKVLDRALRHDFGFQHLLWVFSGRRGIHCWVCDQKALVLDDISRKAIVQYLSVVTGSEGPESSAPVTYPLHPLLEGSLPELEAMFMEHVASAEGQGLLTDGNCEGWEQVLRHIPNESVQQRLKAAWSNTSMTPEQRWEQLKVTATAEAKKVVKNGANGKVGQDAKHLLQCPAAIVFVFVYPRLDINVSTHRNHLLKSPWCVHPKTGRVCVPLDPKTTDQFDPHTVPTLVSLFHEIEQHDRNEKTSEENDENGKQEGGSSTKRRKVSELEKTTLKKYLQYFENEFLQPLLEHHARERNSRFAASSSMSLSSSSSSSSSSFNTTTTKMMVDDVIDEVEDEVMMEAEVA
jgi:DNA primase small subunit